MNSDSGNQIDQRPDIREQTQEYDGDSVPARSNTRAEEWVPRSCYPCSRKKMRCDKQETCSSCARSGVACTYPPRGPRVRRTRKAIIKDNAARIAYLEQSLAEATAKLAVLNKQSSSPESTSHTKATSMRCSVRRIAVDERIGCKQDVLLQQGKSSQYYNETLLCRVIEILEEQYTDKTPASSTQELPPAPSALLFDGHGILSSPIPSLPPYSLHPPTPIAISLWNIYTSNVEGVLGLKLLHIPTDEIKVYSVIDEPSSSPLCDLALCYAVYFASLVSLDGAEARGILARDKASQLLDLKIGLEQSFSQADFLNKPNVVGLQALAIYLSALRVHNRGKGLWILNGLAIRIAQSLGLHRNGELLGLPPFLSEVRRRLWWNLVTRDSRSSEDYGLDQTTTLGQDVNIPLNIDDAQLSPDSKSLPPEKVGWTAMTFSLVQIDLALARQELGSAAGSSSNPLPGEEIRIQIINKARASIIQRIEHCNAVVPWQRMTSTCSLHILNKFDFFSRQQWLAMQNRGCLENIATENSLVQALEILEPQLLADHDLLSPFRWAKRAFPQYDITMYVLWHLCVKPEGPHVDRAWRIVDEVFAAEHIDSLVDGVGSKAAVLASLRAKAMPLRKGTTTPVPQDGGVDLPDPFELEVGNFNFDVMANEWLPRTPWGQYIPFTPSVAL